VGDVGSPSCISRHLVLPLATEKTSNVQGISLEEDSDTDENGDEGKMPSFCVLLHGALKVSIRNVSIRLSKVHRTYSKST